MIEKLEELKTVSDRMLKYSNELKKITNDINAKANKRFILIIFIALFFALYAILVARYFVFSHSSHYNLVQLLLSSLLVSLLFSAIVTAILYVPITVFLIARRTKAYNREKFEIEATLQEINEIYTSLNNYPALLLDYLSPFYLKILIDYQKEGENPIEESIDKLEEEKRNNKKLQYSINAANKRIEIFNHLFDLSLKEGVTATYKDWMSKYPMK